MFEVCACVCFDFYMAQFKQVLFSEFIQYFFTYEIVHKQMQNSYYAQIIPTVSIALEEIYFFQNKLYSRTICTKKYDSFLYNQELQTEQNDQSIIWKGWNGRSQPGRETMI